MSLCLIKKCVCGNDASFDYLIRNKIPLFKCKRCNILHQEVKMSEKEYNDFYSTDYHSDFQTKIGCAPYETRYKHDCDIAKLRLSQYKKFKSSGNLLDIGSGNGAFVDTARKLDWDARGLEPSISLSKNSKYIFNSCLSRSCLLDSYLNYFDMITIHDVFEHLVDPFTGLQIIKDYLQNDGVLVIDFPNYFEDAGKHHWREVQHLWFFDRRQMIKILNDNGFYILEVDKPIESKFVFYVKASSTLSY